MYKRITCPICQTSTRVNQGTNPEKGNTSYFCGECKSRGHMTKSATNEYLITKETKKDESIREAKTTSGYNSGHEPRPTSTRDEPRPEPTKAGILDDFI